MLDALYYALRFLIVATFLAALTWVIVGATTNSELITGVTIAVVNAFVLFATIDRFVESKLDRDGSSPG